MSFHGVPSSEVANKEVIKTRWVLKPRREGVKARFVKPSDDEGFYKVEKALYGHRGSPRYCWKDAVAEAARDLGL